MSAPTNDTPHSPAHADFVYGTFPPRVDDPAENYHEASSWYATSKESETPRATLVTSDIRTAAAVRRAVKRYEHVETVPLLRAHDPPGTLAMSIRNRRSRPSFRTPDLSLARVGTLLRYGYGARSRRAPDSGFPFRTAPSAGALYPLELYLMARRCAPLAAGVYHFDPLEERLDVLSLPVSSEQLRSSFTMETIEDAAAIIVITAMFWRTRFKYGLRGYRFALLEAGHVAQNLLLTAEALRLAAVPLGGFYDSALNALIGVDGVDEASVYAVALGG